MSDVDCYGAAGEVTKHRRKTFRFDMAVKIAVCVLGGDHTGVSFTVQVTAAAVSADHHSQR